MKKILLLSIFLFLCVFIPKVEALESHNTFQEIEMQKGKLLRYFTEEEYNEYYKHMVSKAKEMYFCNATTVKNQNKEILKWELSHL